MWHRDKTTAFVCACVRVCEQMDLLKTTVHLLHGQTDNCLTKIDRLFQDSPTEGVGVYYMYIASWTCMCVCVCACMCVCV